MEIYVLSILLGLTVGSFLNVVIYRTEKNKDFGGRSYCPKCKKNIPWHDNIPLLSYLVLGGRCRLCRQKISWQYPAVEALTALLFLSSMYLVASNLLNDWLGHYFGIAGLAVLFAKLGINNSLTSSDINLKFFEFLFLCGTFSVLTAILVYDLKHMLIPDSFTAAGIVIAVFYNIVLDVLLVAAAAASKNQILILEIAEMAKKQAASGWLPIRASSFMSFGQEVFYDQMVHLKYFPAEKPLQFILSLFMETRTGSGLIAGIAAAAIFFLIVYLSNETWMGMGDVKLVFFLGFLLGVFKTAAALFLAFELGAVLGVALILVGRAKMKTALPFGPFLIAGALLSLVFT